MFSEPHVNCGYSKFIKMIELYLICAQKRCDMYKSGNQKRFGFERRYLQIEESNRIIIRSILLKKVCVISVVYI